MYLIKLGGSMITYKCDSASLPIRWNETHVKYRIREDSIRDAGRVIRKHINNGVIIVHGGGTHGHRTVRRWRTGVAKGPDPMMSWEVKWRMVQLTQKVIDILGSEKVPAIEVAPSDISIMNGSNIEDLDITPIRRILERGGVPVLRGDLAPDIKGGWSVISGDDILVKLSRSFRKTEIEKVILCMNEEGIFKGYGTPEQELIPIADHDLERDDIYSTDTLLDESGGIAGKVDACRRIQGMGITSQIIGGRIAESLEMALSGKGTGTIFPLESRNGSKDRRLV